MNIDEKSFDGYMFVSWSLDEVPLFPFVHMMELAENNPQHKQWSFPALFPLLILSVVPSPLHIKNPIKKIPSCATLETYEEAPIFIPVKISEEAIESVASKISGSSGPGDTDSEAIQGWLLEFGEDSTRLRTSVENFVELLSNRIPPWAAYCAFMSDHLIAMEKQPGVRPVGVGET